MWHRHVLFAVTLSVSYTPTALCPSQERKLLFFLSPRLQLFSYFLPVSFNKAIPFRTLLHTKWLGIHLHLLHKGNRRLTVVLDELFQILEAYLSDGRAYCYLGGAETLPAEERSAVSDSTLFKTWLILPSAIGSFYCV